MRGGVNPGPFNIETRRCSRDVLLRRKGRSLRQGRGLRLVLACPNRLTLHVIRGRGWAPPWCACRLLYMAPVDPVQGCRPALMSLCHFRFGGAMLMNHNGILPPIAVSPITLLLIHYFSITISFDALCCAH